MVLILSLKVVLHVKYGEAQPFCRFHGRHITDRVRLEMGCIPHKCRHLIWVKEEKITFFLGL